MQGVLPFECESRFRLKRPWDLFLPVDRGERFRDFMNNVVSFWKSLATIGKKKGWFNKVHHFLYSRFIIIFVQMVVDFQGLLSQ